MKYEVKKLEKSAVEVKLHLDAAEVSPFQYNLCNFLIV